MVAVGEVTRWLSGGTPNRSIPEYWAGNVPWISASTLKKSEIFESDQHLTTEAVAMGSKMAPVGATLFLVRGSALYNEIRAGLVVAPVCFNQDVKALVPASSVVPKFLTYSLLGRTHDLLKLVSTAGNSAGVLDTKLVQSFEIFLPDPAEQRAIANALSGVDELLDALEALISKKRAVKQASMQQLLTGKTRLPGFSGRWETTTMARIGATYGGLTGKSKEDFGIGSSRYVTFLNVLENVIVNADQFAAVSVAPGESQNKVLKGDLLFNGTSETPGELAMAAVMRDQQVDLYLNSFCFGFRIHDRSQYDPLFLAYYFRGPSGREIMYALAQGTTRYNMSKIQFLALMPSLPKAEEQNAIATVLYDMDAEIAALERRRDKTLAIKQGMLQQLLTGRVRLVEPMPMAAIA
jgi:type I restriction enzyme S subunit